MRVIRGILLLVAVSLFIFPAGIGDAASTGKYSNSLEIRNVKVHGTGGRYVVTGQARPTKGNYFYTVEDGHNLLVEERLLLKKGERPRWTPFKIKVIIMPKMLPRNGTIVLYAYQRDTHGRIAQGYSIPLEKFYH